MFSQASVILCTGGVWQTPPSAHPPPRQTPPLGRHPPARHTPGQTPPRQIPLGRHPPGRHPLADHPRQTPHADTPGRHPRQTPPSADTPRQTTSWADTPLGRSPSPRREILAIPLMQGPDSCLSSGLPLTRLNPHTTCTIPPSTSSTFTIF